MIFNRRSTQQFWLELILIIIIILGIVFRLINIDKKVYWHDEVYTSLRVAGFESNQVFDNFFNGDIITVKDLLKVQQLSTETPFSETIESLNQHPEHPPLYYILLRFWQNIFGSSILINRSLSVLFSLLVLPTIYYLSKEIFDDRLVGLITTALVAISPFQILYAQEAREYSLWMLTISLSTLFFWKSIKNNKTINYLAYSLTLATNFYTSILSVFLSSVNIIYIFINKKLLVKQKINLLILTLISGILFLPWMIIIVNKFAILQDKTSWTNNEKPLSFLSHLWGLHFTSLFLDFNFPLFYWLNYIFILGIFIIIIISFTFLVKNSDRSTWLYLLLLLLIPSLGLILPDLIFGGIRSIYTRYFIPSYLAIYLTIGYYLAIKINSKSPLINTIFVIIFTGSIISNIVNTNAETWWNKGASYHNAKIANILNKETNILLISEKFDINEGNIISLSHQLKPDINLQLFKQNSYIKPEKNYQEIYLYNPSSDFQTKIEQVYNREVINAFPSENIYPYLYKLKK